MPRFRFLLITSLVSFFISNQLGCKKQNNTPKITTINGESFGCEVDGQPFIPDEWDYGNNIPPINISISHISYGGATLRVKAKKQNLYVEIFLNKPLNKGIHLLKFNTRPYPWEDPPKDNGVYVVKNPLAEYITNETIGGYVELIEVDTIANKVHGKFEFVGTDLLTGKVVKVTNGVFKNY